MLPREKCKNCEFCEVDYGFDGKTASCAGVTVVPMLNEFTNCAYICFFIALKIR